MLSAKVKYQIVPSRKCKLLTWTLTMLTSNEYLQLCLYNMRFNTYVATQCAAVTTHRLLRRAPPHDNFFDKNPDLIMAAFNK